MKEIALLLLGMLRAPFTKNLTVAQVVKEMEAQVDNLLKVAVEHNSTAERINAKAERLAADAAAHLEEAERAARVAEKFTSLIK